MSRYIDADEAIRQILNFYTNAERMKMFNFTPNVIKQTVADIISDIPTAEVKPIVYYIEKLKKIKTEIKKLRYGSDTYKNAIDDVLEIIDYEIGRIFTEKNIYRN